MLYLNFLVLFLVHTLEPGTELLWVELKSFELLSSGDPSGSGEVSILMSIGPGQMANMIKGREDYTSAYSGRLEKISGERFYIPHAWIRDQKVILYFMIRERDDPFPDDILLPPRSATICLGQHLFKEKSGFIEINLDREEFKTDQGYEVRNTNLNLYFLRKPVKDCLFKGNDPDAFFAMENERILFLQELRFLGSRQLIGGIEYQQLILDAPSDAQKRDIEIIQEHNFRACNRYQIWLNRFKDHTDFSELAITFKKTIQDLQNRGIQWGTKKEDRFPAFSEEGFSKLNLTP